MRVIPYDSSHNDDLFAVYRDAESWANHTRKSLESKLSGLFGFTIINSRGQVCGSVLFSNYVPGHDAAIHVTVHPDYHGRWLTRTIYRTVFDFAFIELGLPRITGYAIDGYTDPKFHERAGFKWEGYIRNIMLIDGKRTGMFITGILPWERKW